MGIFCLALGSTGVISMCYQMALYFIFIFISKKISLWDMEACRCNLIVGPAWHWLGVTEENPQN
jgi:hypothetical protein